MVVFLGCAYFKRVSENPLTNRRSCADVTANRENHMRNTLKLIAALVALVFAFQAGAATPAAPAAPAEPAAAAGSCPATLDLTFPRLQDEKPQSLCQYAGKVLLIVNTASYCGFTPQYKGLEALYGKYKGQGLVVLGFPSNDFAQESGDNKQIADFCENTYGVKFPMFAKSAVRGSDANPLYRRLAKETGRAPLWNFHKYLIGRNGAVVASYTSMTSPDSAGLVRDIEKQLAAH
jgi:glutathione peroxidase